MIQIAPSVLSVDLTKLVEQIRAAERGGASFFHLDIMDGHFVPNISFGPVIVSTLKSITDLPLDVHLMIDNPELYIHDFAKAGANIITVHQENSLHLDRLVSQIHSFGIKAGIALNPATPETTLRYVVQEIDLVLIMSVNPGFGGQKFIKGVLSKFKWLKEQNPDLILEIDGGINLETAKEAVSSGANMLVAGNSIFKTKDIERATKSLKDAANSLFA